MKSFATPPPPHPTLRNAFRCVFVLSQSRTPWGAKGARGAEFPTVVLGEKAEYQEWICFRADESLGRAGTT